MGTKRGESPHGRTHNMSEYRRNRVLDLYTRVLAGYGGACSCCGETEPKFLTIDHVFGDGAAHRRRIRNNHPVLYLEIIRRGFPRDFRILCANCHLAQDKRGGCPHMRRVYGRRKFVTTP